MATSARSAGRSAPFSICFIDRSGGKISSGDRFLAPYRRTEMPTDQPPRPSAGSRRLAASLYALVFAASVAQTIVVPLLPHLAEVDGLSTAAQAALIAAPGAATFAVAL